MLSFVLILGSWKRLLEAELVAAGFEWSQSRVQVAERDRRDPESEAGTLLLCSTCPLSELESFSAGMLSFTAASDFSFLPKDLRLKREI